MAPFTPMMAATIVTLASKNTGSETIVHCHRRTHREWHLKTGLRVAEKNIMSQRYRKSVIGATMVEWSGVSLKGISWCMQETIGIFYFFSTSVLIIARVYCSGYLSLSK